MSFASGVEPPLESPNCFLAVDAFSHVVQVHLLDAAAAELQGILRSLDLTLSVELGQSHLPDDLIRQEVVASRVDHVPAPPVAGEPLMVKPHQVTSGDIFRD